MTEIATIGNAGMVSEECMQLARELSAIHGRVTIAREASGVHLYMASPECLEQDGRVELTKRHLAVNYTKYSNGKYKSAMCMKTNTPYDVRDLLTMRPLADRGIQALPGKNHVVVTDESQLVDDGKGNKIPPSPGECVPVFRLPKEHPAQQYLASRGYDAARLYQQFRLSWCETERPHKYREIGAGFKTTPQGRIVFFIDVHGVQKGWQARVLEMTTPDGLYYWHPYQKEWVFAAVREGKRWKATSGMESVVDKMAKYQIGQGCKRNQVVMGLDAAIKWNQCKGRAQAVLAEGALDAGRVGPPGIAMLGKFVSPFQAALLAQHFQKLVYVADNDAAGQAAKRKLAEQMQAHPGVELVYADLPEQVKDLGEMSRSDAVKFVSSFL